MYSISDILLYIICNCRANQYAIVSVRGSPFASRVDNVVISDNPKEQVDIKKTYVLAKIGILNNL